MTISALCPMSFTSWFDPAGGAPLQVNAYYYFAGTLDPISVYADAGLASTIMQPVPSSGSGRLPAIWIGELPAGYRVRIFDQYSMLLEDVDYMPGAGGATVDPGPGPSDPTRLIATGDVVFSYSNMLPRAGFVFANGTSVGSALSTATGRANDDAQALFKHLWQQDQFGQLAVFPSRGASADGDWAANKAIATPNIMGRSIVGVDAMGTAAAGRLTGISFDGTGAQDKLGSTFGTALFQLLDLHLPPHTHILTDPGHTHTGTTATHSHTSAVTVNAAGSHAHNIQTYGAGTHAHTYQGGDATLGTGGPYSGWGSTPYAKTTDQVGDHTHTGYTDAQGNHAHTATATVSAGAALAVTLTTNITGITMSGYAGGSQPHPNTQPSIVLCVYMRL